jgi:hypothetical protein
VLGIQSFGAGDRIGCGWAARGMPDIRNSPDATLQ